MTIALAEIDRTVIDYYPSCQLQLCSVQWLLKSSSLNRKKNNYLMIQSTDEMIIFHFISTLQSASSVWFYYHTTCFNSVTIDNRLKALLLPSEIVQSLLIKPSCYTDTQSWHTLSHQDKISEMEKEKLRYRLSFVPLHSGRLASVLQLYCYNVKWNPNVLCCPINLQ